MASADPRIVGATSAKPTNGRWRVFGLLRDRLDAGSAADLPNGFGRMATLAERPVLVALSRGMVPSPQHLVRRTGAA